jgi:hypothetical protein
MGTFAIAVYCLLTKDNKLPFSVSVCSKQTGLAVFVYINIYMAKNRTIYIYKCIDICKSIYMLRFQMESGNPGLFPLSVYRLLIMQMEVRHLSVC